MVNGYGYHLPDRITKPAKMVQTPTAGVLFLWVCRDSRVSGARGAAPCCGKAAISERGEISLCGDKPSAERTRPQGCISAPFVPKGLFAFPALGAFFQIGSRFLARQGKPEKGGGFLVGHGLCFRHNALKDRAPDDQPVAARPAFLLGQLLPQHLFPIFKLPDFLLSVLNLGGQFLAGFLSRFRYGWSLLSAHGQKKRAAVFCRK